MSHAPRASGAPLFWALFGAGGMLAALVGPALVLAIGVQAPLRAGLSSTAMDHAAMRALLHPAPLAALLFVVISLFLWHAAHRLQHSLHDLGIASGRLARLGCYGIALLGTIRCAAALLALAS